MKANQITSLSNAYISPVNKSDIPTNENAKKG